MDQLKSRISALTRENSIIPCQKLTFSLQHSRTLLTPALSEMAGMMGAMGGMGDGMKEAAKKAVEDEIAAKAPGSIKPFFPCLGGPVPTVETCMCMVPADQQDSVKQAIEKYKSL